MPLGTWIPCHPDTSTLTGPMSLWPVVPIWCSVSSDLMISKVNKRSTNLSCQIAIVTSNPWSAWPYLHVFFASSSAYPHGGNYIPILTLGAIITKKKHSFQVHYVCLRLHFLYESQTRLLHRNLHVTMQEPIKGIPLKDSSLEMTEEIAPKEPFPCLFSVMFILQIVLPIIAVS